jgi:hypothetical protein
VYETVLIELERAKLAPSFKKIQHEVFPRLVRLQTLPDLRAEEKQSLSDALSSLVIVAAEEDAYDDEHKRTALENALRTLRAIHPTVLSTAAQIRHNN